MRPENACWSLGCSRYQTMTPARAMMTIGTNARLIERSHTPVVKRAYDSTEARHIFVQASRRTVVSSGSWFSCCPSVSPRWLDTGTTVEADWQEGGYLTSVSISGVTNDFRFLASIFSTIRLPGDGSRGYGQGSGALDTLASVPWFLIGVIGIAWEHASSLFSSLPVGYGPRRGYRDVPVDEDAQILHFEDEE